MPNLPANPKEWKIKFWCAKTFGWTLDYIDSLSIRELNYLIDIQNKETREQKMSGNKNKKTFVGNNYG